MRTIVPSFHEFVNTWNGAWLAGRKHPFRGVLSTGRTVTHPREAPNSPPHERVFVPFVLPRRRPGPRPVAVGQVQCQRQIRFIDNDQTHIHIGTGPLSGFGLSAAASGSKRDRQRLILRQQRSKAPCNPSERRASGCAAATERTKQIGQEYLFPFRHSRATG